MFDKFTGIYKMPKVLLLLLFSGIALLTQAQVQFDRDEWRGMYSKAWKQASEEVRDQFVEGSNWERGKGVCCFVLNEYNFMMKFDAEGHLERVAPRNDFPELVKYDERVAELERQYREEYVKSIGMTFEEAEKAEREKDRAEMQAQLQALREGLAAPREEERRRREEAEKERAKMQAQLQALREGHAAQREEEQRRREEEKTRAKDE